ncbi:MAG: hypothetical protein UT19_C0007G0076 [Candidatus Woesebacteria bacterium GW2011_GWB1_39_10b]|uniref:Uncharacterized protein n=3 Tax=Candidatus Woeseibacteriota TaxID=1752722 RepID=A0A0G0QSB1_9BACT|nr:MAG: hypothetical protein US72_C0008G0033 [Microgenomates group bacterium GW2011_GWC1_38_12]KKQ93832.1 MAG: hypothetical protein UT19_C0007G0076 [Candidatus Woesebacteria bacterium GW2011_GWB1_39_10b]KKR13250.1 MAG: hypothetical protein UT40_C0021G0032 [Candidatus Woesebacteria bacterium GW2011_GWA1_39_21b]OGM64011.1 MAG: hypothetical protein A3A52_05005 [Candidatus Woesebacteria bacterium RIFCSPLOWO2_01_FULL_39_14]
MKIVKLVAVCFLLLIFLLLVRKYYWRNVGETSVWPIQKGRLELIFKDNTNLKILKWQFRLLGIFLPEETLKTKFLVLSTPKRGLSAKYIAEIEQDSWVMEVGDYTVYLNDQRQKTGEYPLRTLKDKDYLYVKLNKLLSRDEAKKWLEQYPGLWDEGLEQINKNVVETPMVDTVTGEVVSGGSSNGWNYSLTQTVNILPGWEREYAAVLKRIGGVEKVEFIPTPLP